MVTHGGMSTISEASYRHLPMEDLWEKVMVLHGGEHELTHTVGCVNLYEVRAEHCRHPVFGRHRMDIPAFVRDQMDITAHVATMFGACSAQHKVDAIERPQTYGRSQKTRVPTVHRLMNCLAKH